MRVSAEKQAVANDRRDRDWPHRKWALVAPTLLAVTIFLIVPLLIMAIYSFLTAGPYGGVVWEPSIDSYVSILFQRDILEQTLQFTPDYLLIFSRSIIFAAITTLFCLAVGFPTAYYMAMRPPFYKTVWIFLITIPFWSNFLIRTLAVQQLLRNTEEIIAALMTRLGYHVEHVTLLYTNFSVVLGLLYGFLPFMILPIYASLEKLDFRLIEAGYDLYASKARILWYIVIPLAKPGIYAGSFLVFVPALGAYVTPLILGGGGQLMIGSLIALQFGEARNWPFGAAIAVMLVTAVILGIVIQSRRKMKTSTPTAPASTAPITTAPANQYRPGLMK